MLWTIFAVLVVLWLLGWGFQVGGSLVHLLLVAALLIALFHVFSARKTLL